MLNFDDLNPAADEYATQLVDRLLQAAIAAGASDVHLEQTASGVLLRWRVDGGLIDLGSFPDGKSTSILARVKALARLVTYRRDIPQEGRIVLRGMGSSSTPPRRGATAAASEASAIEARVGTLPILHGERAVIRLANQQAVDWLPDQLGLEAASLLRLRESLAAASGVVLITGPAGAGKTTTAYACLRYLLQDLTNPRSLVSLEDPIESELAGVSQSQVHPAGGYSWSDGLKALLRQDPEVMLVGEIRDPETASVVFQAAMTGQLVISTMHARTAGDAVRRLLDMHVPVHHLRSALDYLLCQRLVRAECPECHAARADCQRCLGTGLHGRRLSSELLPTIEGSLAESIQQGASSSEIQRAAQSLGMQTLATLHTL